MSKSSLDILHVATCRGPLTKLLKNNIPEVYFPIFYTYCSTNLNQIRKWYCHNSFLRWALQGNMALLFVNHFVYTANLNFSIKRFSAFLSSHLSTSFWCKILMLLEKCTHVCKENQFSIRLLADRHMVGGYLSNEINFKS